MDDLLAAFSAPLLNNGVRGIVSVCAFSSSWIQLQARACPTMGEGHGAEHR